MIKETIKNKDLKLVSSETRWRSRQERDKSAFALLSLFLLYPASFVGPIAEAKTKTLISHDQAAETTGEAPKKKTTNQSKNQVTIEKTTGVKGLRIQSGLDYFSLKIDAESSKVSSYGASLGLAWSYGESLSFSGETRQGYSKERNVTALFSSVSLGGSYAITGSSGQLTSQVSADGEAFYSFLGIRRDGVRAGADLTQYIFNAGDRSLLFTGVSFSFFYEKNINSNYSIVAGVAVERLSNGTSVALPIRAFLKTSFAIGAN